MTEEGTDKKIPIYQLKTKAKVLDFYVNWEKKAQFNKDMINWNYQASQNTIKIFNQHT